METIEEEERREEEEAQSNYNEDGWERFLDDAEETERAKDEEEKEKEKEREKEDKKEDAGEERMQTAHRAIANAKAGAAAMSKIVEQMRVGHSSTSDGYPDTLCNHIYITDDRALRMHICKRAVEDASKRAEMAKEGNRKAE